MSAVVRLSEWVQDKHSSSLHRAVATYRGAVVATAIVRRDCGDWRWEVRIQGQSVVFTDGRFYTLLGAKRKAILAITNAIEESA